MSTYLTSPLIEVRGAIRGPRKKQVRCQGENTYILEEDIKECFRTGRGLALALGGPRVLIGVELRCQPENPDHTPSGQVHQRDCGTGLAMAFGRSDFESV